MKKTALSGYRPPAGVPRRSLWTRICWAVVSEIFFANRLVAGSAWKRSWLRLFGARVGRGVVIKPAVRIKYPWNLGIGDHSWIGEGVWIDNIVDVRIASDACLSQGAYLCTGNHDWTSASFDLTARPIVIEEGVWVGAAVVVGPGVTLRSHSVVTAGSVVSRSTEAYKIYRGNPAVAVKERIIR